MRIPVSIFAVLSLFLASCAKKGGESGDTAGATEPAPSPGVISADQPDAPSGGTGSSTGGVTTLPPVIVPPPGTVTPPTAGNGDTTAPLVVLGDDLAVRQAHTFAPTVTDAEGVVTYAWWQVDGPGTLTFASPDAKDTLVTATADGVYTIRLVATDAAGNAGQDELKLTWDTVAPTIDAGADRIVNASFSQDATPGEAGLSYRWTKVAGPGDVFFGAATSEDTSINISADGQYVVRVTATDAAGNSAADELTVFWDTTAPIVDVGPDLFVNGSSVDATATDVTALTYAWTKVSGPGNVVFGSPTSEDTTITAGADGVYVIRLAVIDALGNGAADELTLSFDSTPPVAGLSGLPADPSNATSLAVNVTGTDVSHYRKKLGPAGSTTCSDGNGYDAEQAVATAITDTLGADGTLRLCVVGRDLSGNWQSFASAATHQWTKDTTAPTATYSGQPANPSNATGTSITVAGTDVTHYRTKIAAAADCSNAIGYGAETAVATTLAADLSGVADAALVLCLIGRDVAGNWQSIANATSYGWTKDTQAPTADVTGAPTGTSSDTALAVTVGGTGVTHYRKKFGPTASTDCSVAAGYGSETAVATGITDDFSALTDGDVTLCVIGRDAAANWQSFASATTRTWTKDSDAPVATYAGEPSDPSNATSLAITVGGAGVTHYRHKVGPTSSTDCTDIAGYGSETAVATQVTDSLAAQGDVSLTFCVIGRDSASNWQATADATSYEWTKDIVAPTASQSGAPSGEASVTTLAITVGGTGVTQYRYKVGAAGSTTCSDSSGYAASTAIATQITPSISAVAEGLVRLCLVGRDAAGNWQSFASATAHTWTKDTQAPTADVTGAPTGTSGDTTLAVTVSGTGVTHYRKKLGPTASTDCSVASGYGSETGVATGITDDFSAITDGGVTLCVIGRDAASNWQSFASATTRSWTKDSDPPVATHTGEPSDPSNATSLAITVGGAGVTHYRHKVGPTSSTDCTNITGYGSETAVATQVTDSLAAHGDVSLTFCVIGRDSASNYQAVASATSYEWTKDTAAPTALQTGAPTGNSNVTTLAITVSGTGVTHYRHKVGAAGSTTCSDSSGYGSETAVATGISTSISAVAEGLVRFCLIGRDAAGNWQAFGSATTTTWTKKTTAPQFTALALANEAVDLYINAADRIVANAIVGDATGQNFTTAEYALVSSITTCSGVSTWGAKPLNTSSAFGADGSYKVCVRLSDDAGNAPAYGASDPFALAMTGPTVTLGSAAGTYTNTNPIAFTATFSASVTGFTSGDVSVTGGSVAGVSGSGASYTINVTPSGQGLVTVNVAANVAFDGAGNGNSAAGSAVSRTYDTVVPTVSGGVTSTAGNGTYSTGQAIPITVTFSEAVTVTGTPSLALNTTPARSATYTSGTGTNVLTFTYTTQAGDGSLDLDYAATNSLSGTIRDAAGNNATLTLPTPGTSGSLGFSKAIVIDTIAASITSVDSTSASRAYGAGSVITIRVNYSENVAVSGTPTIALATSPARSATYSSGDGTEELLFTYTVQAGDISGGLEYSSMNALSLNGGSITDGSGNSSIVLPAIGGGSSLGDTSEIIIDTSAPNVTGVDSDSLDGAYSVGNTIEVAVSFNEAVVVSGTPRVALNVTPTQRYALYTAGSGTGTLVFTYTVGSGDLSSDLDYLSVNALELNGGTILDLADNAAVRTLVAPGADGSLGYARDFVVDHTLPPSLAVSGIPSTTHAAAITLTVTFPANTAAYDEVQVLRGNGATAPADCEAGTLAESINSFSTNPTVVIDSTGGAGKTYSYRVCALNANGDVIGTATVTNITSSSFHWMFTTSAAVASGNLGGLAGADAICQAAGEAKDPTLTWVAVLSTTTEEARGRLPIAGPVYNLNATRGTVANSHSDLWDGTIGATVQYSELGTSITSGNRFTGTGSAGTRLTTTCNNWTSNSSAVTGGRSSMTTTTSTWITNSTGACNVSTYRILCASRTIQPLTGFTVSRPTSGTDGDVTVSIDVPSDVSNWSKVEVRRALGVTAPSCTTGTVAKTYNAPSIADDTFTDPTGTPHRFYAYTVCVYTGAAVAAAYTKTMPVRTFNNTAAHMVFVTSTTYTGSAVGGLTGADQKCQLRGDTFIAGKVWKAVLSSGTVAANSRVSLGGQVRNLNGTLIANNHADFFDGTIAAAISVRDTFATTTTALWTGSTSTGGSGTSHCTNWTSASSSVNGMRGAPNSATSTWLTSSTNACNNARALYCITDTAD